MSLVLARSAMVSVAEQKYGALSTQPMGSTRGNATRGAVRGRRKSHTKIGNVVRTKVDAIKAIGHIDLDHVNWTMPFVCVNYFPEDS